MVGYGGHNVVLEETWQGGAHTYNMVPWELTDLDGLAVPYEATINSYT